MAGDPCIAADAALLRAPTERLRALTKQRTRTFASEVPKLLHNVDSSNMQQTRDALLALRQRLVDSSEQETQQLERITSRVHHLARLHAGKSRKRSREQPDTSGCASSSNTSFSHQQEDGDDPLKQARNERCNRLLADHFMRLGAVDISSQYAKSVGVSSLVDEDLHRELFSIASSLSEGEPSSALEWCSTHKQKLKKAGSMLEFKLRLKQLVQMARSGSTSDAVTHARAHLSVLAASSERHLNELSGAMLALAAPRSDAAQHADVAWGDLATMFTREACRCYGLQQNSLLDTYVQAGLIALKDPVSDNASSTPDDPMRYSECAGMAQELPRTKRTRSRLICPMTNKIMDEDNPPLVLGNGRVYSKEALSAMARENGGKVWCDKTGDGPFEYSQLRRAYFA